LIIPEGVVEIPFMCFEECHFSSVSFPSTLKRIEEEAFYLNQYIIEPLIFPEGLLYIGERAFFTCNSVPSIVLPESLQTILTRAFYNCYDVSSIICKAIEPPYTNSTAFEGIAKDNFTIEVPPQSVKRYQSEDGWRDFKRIAAHYDFSISRKQMRALNGSISRTFVLRAPANYAWSLQEKPGWVTVEHASGIGKTDITITVSEMAADDVGTFEVNEGKFNRPSYVSYEGRAGEIVFGLDNKDYTCSMNVEQYDYDHSDGSVVTKQTHSEGSGIPLVFLGDCYDAADIASGSYQSDTEEAIGYFFDIEQYTT
jgi:hypothetical protein